jgi:hypothetical protein
MNVPNEFVWRSGVGTFARQQIDDFGGEIGKLAVLDKLAQMR